MIGSSEDMESIALDDSLTPNSFSNHGSAPFTPSDSCLLSPWSTDTDPLFSPPIPLSLPQKFLCSPSNSRGDLPFYAGPRGDDDAPEFEGSECPIENPQDPVSLSSLMSPSSSLYLHVTVSNPQKEVESVNSIVPRGGTFMTYQITTRTNLPEFGGSEFVVRRRFKDVVTLSDALAEAYRGYFIPPRPEKCVLESQVMQKRDFVEQRRVALEKYLRKLVVHPVIRNSDELRVFLQARGRLPLAMSADMASRILVGAAKLPNQLFSVDSSRVVEPQDLVQPTKGVRDLWTMFKELKQSVKIDWGGSRPLVEEDDKNFLESKGKLDELEQVLSNTSKQAESLVKAQQDMGETIGELGLAFIKLAKFENEQAILDTQKIRAADMKHVYTAAIKSGRFYRGLNAQTVKHLDTIHDYLGLMLAVHNAFSDRSRALLTVQTLLSDLYSMRSRAGKLEAASSKIFGGDKSRVHKLDELKKAIRVTEDAKQCAVDEYQRIKEHNRWEIERINGERKVDFLEMLTGFISNQVAYSEKIRNEWAKAAEETSGYV